MAFYDGDKPGGIPGQLPASAAGDYNWWEAGALFGQVRLSPSRDIASMLTEVI